MKPLHLLAPFLIFLNIPILAQEAVPPKALKYHEALLKRPENDTLFERFFSSWIDEKDIATLEKYLTEEAAQNGGANLAILARYQLRRGQEEEALATLGKAMAALPEKSSLAMERAKILLRRLDFEAARKDLTTAAAGSNQAIALEASKLIGKSWLREGNPEQAIKVWDALLAANPGDEDLLEDLVESAAAEGETEQALAYVDKLIAAGADPYKKTLRQLRRGDLLAQVGQHDEAIAAYSATLENVGEGSWLEREVLAQIDTAFRKQDRLDDLKNKFAELAEANPRRLLIHRLLAKIEASQGETDAAVGRFREVLKRSPGNRELREEFVRLLTDSEKFDEAAEELEKLIAQAPEDPALLLQMADLRNRQKDKEATLAALKKAHELLGTDEPSGIRIASLMFQYELAEEGETLLKTLAAAENASIAPSEALASEYARTNRKPEALAILQKIGTSENLDTVLRAAASVSALGETEAAFEILSAKSELLGKEPRFLSAIAQAALAANKPEIAVTHAIRLVRFSSQSVDLTESIGLALRAIAAADKSIQWRETLEKQDARTPAETCLLAALADSHGDFDAVAKIMEGATDPLVIHFHSALLDRRGDLKQAIAVLSRLADTDEGRKTSFFKDMTELQRRAGLTEDALATVERWKQSAPGDKTAWVTGGSILRENGQAEEAVAATRQAVARFDNDTDLAATLASLHEESGQMQDAEAIYWRLYDDSENPRDQARWAVSLANLALQTGRTAELEEKLRERARGNRRSVGPVLAQAELARIMKDDDKRRDLLLEAVSLQPKDTDLRLQIANLEEQSGNPDRVVAILEEAVDMDNTGRIRSALAQAYLRMGQTLKGMRELRAISGKQADDPRTIEQSAAMLAGSGLYEEAIRFHREALPDGGDWRTRYLLATMLEQDGRETEAVPLFQTLRQATGELPNVSPPQRNNNRRNGMEDYSESLKHIINLMTSGQAAYAHRATDNSGYYYSSQQGAKVGPFVLPDSVESVRTLSLIHLAKLGVKNLDNADFINELTETSRGQTDFPALLAKYPDQPGLLDITLMYGSYGNRGTAIDKDLLRKLLAERDDLSLRTRFQSCMLLMRDADESDPVWKEIVTISNELAKEDDEKKGQQTGFMLLRLLSDETLTVPETTRKELSSALISMASAASADAGPFQGFKLAAISSVGTTDQLLTAMNSEVEDFRKEANNKPISPARQMQSYYGNMGYNQWNNGENPFKIPAIEEISMSSVPPHLLSMIRLPEERGGYFGFKPADPKTLLPHLEKISSPALRAWIAIRASDSAATEKALAATPPENEKNDFTALRAYQATVAKDYPAAYTLFSELRPAYSSDRNLVNSLNLTLLAIAAEMKEEERKEITGELRALLIQARNILGPQAGQRVGAHAVLLGMPELAKRFQPPAFVRGSGTSRLGAATFGSQPSSTSSGGNASIEKMRKFSTTGKTEAAAMEALNLIRKANANQYNSHYELRQIKENITPEVTKALFKMTDPGDSKSLTKLMEYADICANFGKLEEAKTILIRLHEERPDDASIAGKLAFLLPAEKRKEAIDLISKAASNAEFPGIASSAAEELGGTENNLRTFAYFTTVTEWLETEKPEDLEKTNLTWVAYHAKQFLERRYLESGFRSLLDTRQGEPQDKKLQAEYTALAKRLTLAILRHPAIAEEGFRLLNKSEAWKISVKEMDVFARQSLLAAASRPEDPYSNSSFFTLRRGNGSSSSGDDLDESSSVKWITSRLATAKSPDEILPPEFLKQLQEKDANIATLVSALAGLSDIKELETLWESDPMKKATGSFSKMLRQGVLARAGTIPGANEFFLKMIREIKPVSRQNGYRSDDIRYTIFAAALTTASAGDAKNLEETCSAITTAVYGEEIDFDQPGDGMLLYQAISTMENIFQNSTLAPASAAKVIGTFYGLGVPVARQDYYLVQPFQNMKIPKAEEGEKLFESLGWLDGAATWKPLAAIIMDANHNAGKVTFTRKDEFLQPRVFSYMNFGYSRSDMAKHLEARKPATFGSLITAAALVEGSERTRLAEKAFTLAAPEISKMKPERVSAFTPVLSWLPAQAMAKLPASFREKADAANEEKRKKLVEAADAFLKDPQANNQGNNPLEQVREMVGELATVDMEKSVELFVAAEKRFTDGLRTGMRLSSSSSNGLEMTERDRALYNILRSSNSPIESDPALALRFHHALAKSPAATRMSFAGSYNAIPALLQIGEKIYNTTPQKPENEKPRWLAALEDTAGMPEEIRKDARIALGIWFMGNHSFANGVKLPRDRDDLAKMKDLPEEFATLRAASIGISEWENDTPEGRETTRKALLALSGDETDTLATRFHFISTATTMAPDILTNPELASRFADLFEAYAGEERSILNTVSLQAAKTIGRTTITDANRPFLTRINAAFWENANSPKPGGHPPIPANVGDDLFLAAAKVGDDVNAKKLLGIARPLIEGNVEVIASLIGSGNHALAMEMLSPPERIYRRFTKLLPYDRDFEKRLAEFRKNPGLDPLALLRLEVQLMDAPPVTGKDAPEESEAQRELRLATTYKANPPADKLLRTELISSMIRDSHTAAIALHDEVLALRKELDFRKSLDDWREGAGSEKEPSPRHILAPLEAAVFRQAAFLDLLDGDASGLNAVAEVIESLPPYSSSSPTNGERRYVEIYLDRLSSSAALWIAEAIHQDKTEAFKDAFEPFSKLSLLVENRKELQSYHLFRVVVFAEFFAYWENDGKRFEALRTQLKRDGKKNDYLKKRQGFRHLADMGNRHRMWKREATADIRHSLVLATLTRPEMKSYFGHVDQWVPGAADKGLRDEILKIAEAPPAGIPPAALTLILEYRAEQAMKKKKYAEAIAYFRKSMEACPQENENGWPGHRATQKIHLTRALIRASETAEAKTLYASITKEEIPKSRKNLHRSVGRELDKALKK